MLGAPNTAILLQNQNSTCQNISVYKWIKDKLYSKAYSIPAAFWYHHCTWDMITFSAGVVITTKRCSPEFASSASQSFRTIDFTLHILKSITIGFHFWGPSETWVKNLKDG
jgi:hypothetical protein